MKFAAVVLAAGLSQRMGVLKPLLPVGKQKAITRCLGTLQAAGIDDIYVVSGHCHQQLEAAIAESYPETRCIYNPHYQQGMLSSVRAGFAALPPETDGWFLLPADCCAIENASFSLLMLAFEQQGGQAIIYPSLGEKQGHPPLIPYDFCDGLNSYEGPNGMKGYLRDFPGQNLPLEDAGILLDMDTPEDYSLLLRQLKLPTYPNAATCMELLDKYQTSPAMIKHGIQVAILAEKIARLLEKQGLKLNIELLQSASLLHDMLRHEPEHAQAAARLLLQEGYPEAAIPISLHMDAPPKIAQRIDETALLYLADKLSRQGRLMRLEETLMERQAAFAANPEAQRQASRRLGLAQDIMALLNSYGLGYEQIFDESLKSLINSPECSLSFLNSIRYAR